MAIETINIGTSPNDGTGDPLRVAFDKTNDNFLTITADGGNEITVLNPTTATDTDLNVALQDILDASGGATPNLEQVLTEGNESTTQDAIFRLDADKYIKIDRANQVIQFFDLTIDAVNPISIFNKDTISFIDGTGSETYINAGYINNLFNDGSTSEIFGSNILLTNVGTSLNLTNELMELNNGIDSVSYRVDKIVVNGVDYPLPTGATSQIATLLDIPTIDATPTDGSSNAVSSNGVFDALALKQNINRSETFIFSKANGTFGSHTGNTTETVILTSSITGGVFEIGDWLNLMYDFTITGTSGTKTIRFRAGTTGTTADALIGTAFFTATVLDGGWSRERMQFKTGNILSGIANNYTANAIDVVPSTSAKQSTSLNPANTWILSVSVQLANSADTVSCEGYVISRVKSF